VDLHEVRHHIGDLPRIFLRHLPCAAHDLAVDQDLVRREPGLQTPELAPLRNVECAPGSNEERTASPQSVAGMALSDALRREGNRPS